MAQRDAAIKVNGLGATCLVYDGNEFSFKLGPISHSDRNQMKIKDNIQKYIKDQIYNVNLNLEKNDVVI